MNEQTNAASGFPTETTILIVGAGPSGLFTAFLLARKGHSCIVLERQKNRLGQPKAHAINPRSLEIFRQSCLDTSILRNLGSHPDDSFWVRFTTGLDGSEFAKLPYERQDEGVKEFTPEPLFNMPQPLLEEFLEKEALRTSLVQILRSWQWESYEEDGEGLISSIRSRTDSSIAVRLRSKVVIGADGINSTVRANMANVAWEAPEGFERPKNVYRTINVRANLRPILKDRKGQLIWCFHPDHTSGMIIYDIDSFFVHVHRIDPSRELTEDYDEEACKAVIRPCVGYDVDFEILSTHTWYTWPRLASSYSTCDNRVHLVGDAAHSFSPQGGLGINTGIADAHNLAWKLSLALKSGDRAMLKSLSSYTSERRPVAYANSLQSTHNEDQWSKFGLIARDLVSKGMRQGCDVSSYVGGDDTFIKELELNKPHFDSLGLQIGYMYGTEARTTKIGSCSVYNPSSYPGARVPHSYLSNGSSTLDILQDDRFSLLHWQLGFQDQLIRIGCLDVLVQALDVSNSGAKRSWQNVMSLHADNAVLVRPDQHILAHVSNAEEIKTAVLSYLLGQDHSRDDRRQKFL